MKTNMRIPGIIFFAILLFWGISGSKVLAQNQYDSPADSMLRPSIKKTNPVRLILDEVQIFYEVPKNQFRSIEYKIGMVHPGPLAELASRASLTSFYHWGLLGGIGYRWYSKKPKTFNSNRFFQTAVTLKLKYMPKQEYCGGDCSSSGIFNLIMDQQLYTLNYQIIKGNFWYQKHSDLIHEIYYGIGVNISYVQTNYFGCDDPNYCEISQSSLDLESIKGSMYTNPPAYDQGWYILPTLHIGYKLGWKKKRKN